MPDVIALPAQILAKPAFGAPCNGCGFCCAVEPCGLAREFIGAGEEGPCPALEFENGRAWCGLVRRPGHYLGLPHPWADEHLAAEFAAALGTGRGCDAAIFEDEAARPLVPGSRQSYSNTGC